MFVQTRILIYMFYVLISSIKLL